MQSAFGVDHEVSKALTPRGKRRQVKAQNRAAQIKQRQQRIGTLKAVPGKVTGAKVSIKDVGTTAGKAVQGVGAFATKRPGVTGAAVIGAGGYGAYKATQPKKRTVL